MWWNKIIKKKYLDEIQYTEVFAVADAKTIEIQKYRKILVWWNYRILTVMLRHSFWLILFWNYL